MPIVKEYDGNIVEAHKQGVHLVARICDSMKQTDDRFSGEFEEVVAVDTDFPLPALYRLGNYSVARTEFGSVLNFYVKLRKNDPIEYTGLASCLKKLSMEAINSGNYIELAIEFPKDLANLDVIKKILNYQEQLLVTLITYDQGQVSMGEE
jgi:hypothetical protein